MAAGVGEGVVRFDSGELRLRSATSSIGETTRSSFLTFKQRLGPFGAALRLEERRDRVLRRAQLVAAPRRLA